ncbi:hypothetical protein H4R33_006025 [Dimargaris cristalligena]|uniref:Uncharacterized protein n=1 Tax=Dimargaris cristalligena TaxID=215637 RepID=A0A4P9ZT25_9FUNG|nr:hypothetical protein H4R33_006025 [Dimargaris cristalligena]RKP36617.1 hypothetical protein BJ085DRAFT_39819 [Dimargaris cristalligena]|eukprot:RKP36617.1 hypothetical protein BJ085DRAFT_39819 [Dimargaris cristalligena]
MTRLLSRYPRLLGTLAHPRRLALRTYATTPASRSSSSSFFYQYGNPLLTVLLYSSGFAYTYHLIFQFLLADEVREEKERELDQLRLRLAELEEIAKNSPSASSN